jgi:hypothetical protein
MIFAINHLYLLKRQPRSKSLVYAKFFRPIQMPSDWLISALQAEANNQAPACDRVLCASGKHVWRGLAQDASDSLRVDGSMSVNAIFQQISCPCGGTARESASIHPLPRFEQFSEGRTLRNAFRQLASVNKLSQDVIVIGNTVKVRTL